VREIDLYNNNITADWDDDEENEEDEGVGDDAGNEVEDANEAPSDDADVGVDAEVNVHDTAFDDGERDASDDRLHLPCSHGKTT
jgi:hypothetical protein